MSDYGTGYVKPLLGKIVEPTDPRAALADYFRTAGTCFTYDDREKRAGLPDELARDIAAFVAERGVLLVPAALIDALRTGTLPGSTDQEKAGIQYAFMWLKQQLLTLPACPDCGGTSRHMAGCTNRVTLSDEDTDWTWGADKKGVE